MQGSVAAFSTTEAWRPSFSNLKPLKASLLEVLPSPRTTWLMLAGPPRSVQSCESLGSGVPPSPPPPLLLLEEPDEPPEPPLPAVPFVSSSSSPPQAAAQPRAATIIKVNGVIEANRMSYLQSTRSASIAR